MKHETLLLATSLSLVGCGISAGLTAANQERLKLYETHSTPVESFQITKLNGRQTRWSPIGDQALMVYDETDQPYLLQLPEKCSGLATARSIEITNASGTVRPGTDFVKPMSPSKAGSAYFCRIGSARRIDMDAVKDAREEMREASAVERDASGGEKKD